jgi:hypothetical protein
MQGFDGYDTGVYLFLQSYRVTGERLVSPSASGATRFVTPGFIPVAWRVRKCVRVPEARSMSVSYRGGEETWIVPDGTLDIGRVHFYHGLKPAVTRSVVPMAL